MNAPSPITPDVHIAAAKPIEDKSLWLRFDKSTLRGMEEI